MKKKLQLNKETVAVLNAREMSKVVGQEGATPECPVIDPGYAIFIAHPTICALYYLCSMGVAYLKECPAALHFNPELETCDYPDRAGCKVETPIIPPDHVGTISCQCPTKVACP